MEHVNKDIAANLIPWNPDLRWNSKQIQIFRQQIQLSASDLRLLRSHLRQHSLAFFGLFLSIFQYLSVFFNVFQYFPIFVSIFSGNRSNFRVLTFDCSEAICIGSNVQTVQNTEQIKREQIFTIELFYYTIKSWSIPNNKGFVNGVHIFILKSIFSSSKATWDMIYFLLYCRLGRKKLCVFNFDSIALI